MAIGLIARFMARRFRIDFGQLFIKTIPLSVDSVHGLQTKTTSCAKNADDGRFDSAVLYGDDIELIRFVFFTCFSLCQLNGEQCIARCVAMRVQATMRDRI